MPTPPFFFGQNTGQGPCRSGSCIIIKIDDVVVFSVVVVEEEVVV